ncbi:hypothetical protein JMJ35_004577 [Cladonia borealis]|uniref:Nephrocystin 3-like N-terminal domain-containing protein n=1 Tax=Cladonia borealis TaxID=184061 RepID=A0AA39R0G3_9LECA|nr:hypothetical protein JMJ35_004577 [Cladonia borealis]
MASSSLPRQLHIQGTSAKDGGQSFAGVNQGTINYAASNDKPYARFNAYQRQHDPRCLPDTRVDLLQKIYDWADGRDERSIFWLNGLAGTGKSTVARTVARKYYDQKRLGASFFFSRDGGDVGHAGKFVTSIAWQLASSVPSLDQYVCDAIKERRDIASQSLCDQWHQLVLCPLSRLSGSGGQFSYILVVDALDECDNNKDIRIIVYLLSEAQSLKTARLRIFLTSRPEVPIRKRFVDVPDGDYQNFILHNISPSIVDQDIRTFLEHGFELITKERSLAASWLGQEIIKRLVHSTSGLFIWAATACRFIRDGRHFAARRLNIIVENSSVGVNAVEKHLNEIYTTILRNCISPEYSYEEAEELLSILKSLLRSIVTVHVFLREHLLHWLEALGWMGKMPEGIHAIASLESFSSSSYCPGLAAFIHDAKRFVLYNRSTIEQAPLQIYCSALIFTPTTSIVKKNFEYQIPNWVRRSIGVQKDWSNLLLALEGHFKPVYGVAFSPDNKQLASASWDNTVRLWDTSTGTALQTLKGHLDNVNAVAFSKDGKQLASASDDTTVRLWDIDIGAILQTLKGHLDCVLTVAFSPDGKHLASASCDKTIRFWNAKTGAALQMLKGHSDNISAVTFSPDSKQLASASHDMTVRLWDISTGAALLTLEGHLFWVSTVVFSPDGKHLASASYDETIRFWNAKTGAALQTLEGHSKSVKAVEFSRDGKQMASASLDKTVQLWDAATGEILQTLEGHSDCVSAVAFSSDSKQMASASYDKTIRLWDTTKLSRGITLQTLEDYSRSVSAVAISPDGKQLAIGSDGIVRLLDAAAGEILQSLKGHLASVDAITFSPDGKKLASVSWYVIRLWDTATGAALQTIRDPFGTVRAVAFSPDSKQLASASGDTVYLWDSTTGAALQELRGLSRSIISIAFSHDGKQLATASDGSEVKLWDIATQVLLQMLRVEAVRKISVSSEGFCLETDRELLDLTPSFRLSHRLPNAWTIFVEGPWVTRRMENLLWLHPDYRPNTNRSCVAVREGVVVLGHGSGRFLILELI